MIRWLIREILSEDRRGFMDRTANVRYARPMNTLSYSVDSTFHDKPDSKLAAREVKRAWAAEADHEFMNSVTKVHWIKDNIPSAIRSLVASDGRDEVSTMGYRRAPYKSNWADIGLRLDGRTTLAANDMNKIFSGYRRRLSPDVIEKFRKTSGVPRRASAFDPETGKAFIFDSESFDPKGVGNNEFIVDNWKVTGVVFSTDGESTLGTLLEVDKDTSWYRHYISVWLPVLKVIEELKLPYVNKTQGALAKKVLALEGAVQ